jgi:hypothetical protein
MARNTERVGELAAEPGVLVGEFLVAPQGSGEPGAQRGVGRPLACWDGTGGVAVAGAAQPPGQAQPPCSRPVRLWGSKTWSSSLTCNVMAGLVAVMRLVRTRGSARREPCDVVFVEYHIAALPPTPSLRKTQVTTPNRIFEPHKTTTSRQVAHAGEAR